MDHKVLSLHQQECGVKCGTNEYNEEAYTESESIPEN